MYTPPAFRLDDLPAIHAALQAVRLATLVTSTADGLLATPLPLYLVPEEGPMGTLYGHVARANPQWRAAPIADVLAIFQGPDAYITPSWYETKRETGKVVPTWNYVAVHAHGPVSFFTEPDRLHAVVDRLTNLHEAGRPDPWAVADAPEAFVAAQLKGIVGLRLPITRLEGKLKASQNRNAADRAGVAAGLKASAAPSDRTMAALVPE